MARQYVACLFLGLCIATFGSNLALTSVPIVRACDTCTFLLTWGSRGLGNGQFNDPVGVAVDSSGNVYVVDSNNNRVEKFDGSGNFLLKWGSYGSGNGQFHFPVGVAVDSSGNVYITDSTNSRVEKFDSSGNFLLTWGSRGIGNGQFGIPFGVAVDSSGNVYVTDDGYHRVDKFDSSGNFLLTWGSDQFTSPLGVAVDSSGNVYVVDSNNNRVEKFDGSGNFLLKWGSVGSGNGQLNGPNGVAVDSSGKVYVADGANYRVQKFDGFGNFLLKWGSRGSGNGQLNGPNGVAVDSSGNVYVTDGTNARVELFGDTLNPILTTNVASGSGSISPNCPSGCSEVIGSSVTITETPSSGWQFSDWSVSGTSCSGGLSSRQCSFTMPNNGVSVSAAFVKEVTVIVSYSVVGGGNPSPPVLYYFLLGIPQQYTLTTTPTALTVDGGSAWSVTNPLLGSGASERWWISSSNGMVKLQTLVFQYQHQFKLTMNAKPSSGLLTGSPGNKWENSGASVNIQVTPASQFMFQSWTGSGTGSYTGTNNPATVTMNGPITETANFQQTGN